MGTVYREIAETGKHLTAAQLHAYNEDGYIILRGLLTPQEIQTIKDVRTEYEAKAQGHTKGFHEGPAHLDIEPLKSDPTGQTMRLRKVQEIFLVCRAFADVTASPKILDITEDLIGPEIYYHSSKLMCKPAHGGRRKPWHQDFAYWADMNTQQVTVWYAIDPATRANGCMQVIPGSHKRGLIPHHNLEDFMIDETNIGREKIVVAEMAPGDVLFFNVLTLHASDPNMSPNPRLSAIVDFDSQPKPEGRPYGSTTPLRTRGANLAR
jgi:phytanoyl-CoA hydroxylase